MYVSVYFFLFQVNLLLHMNLFKELLNHHPKLRRQLYGLEVKEFPLLKLVIVFKPSPAVSLTLTF